MDFKFITADEREKLYNEVWAEPIAIVAQRYNISDTGLSKHCMRFGIPLPYRGYWAKINGGATLQKPSLPAVTGELRKYVRNYAIKYRTDIDTLTDSELMSDEEFNLLREETKTFIRELCSNIQVKSQLRDPHNLIEEHKEEVVYRRKRDKELKQASFNSKYYTSVKSKYRDNKPILPINVRGSNINRVYRILDSIIKTLKEMEGYTQVSIEAGEDTGYFAVMRADFHFKIREEVKKKETAKNDDTQFYLVLTMSASSWFEKASSQEMEFKDTNDELLEDQVGKIIYSMFVVANRLYALDLLEARKQNREWEEQERLKRLEQMRKGELKELKLLEEISYDWDKAQRIRRFADDIESKVNTYTDKEKKEKILDWIKWARDKADWIDPLIEKEDEILGKSKHIYDLINEMNL